MAKSYKRKVNDIFDKYDIHKNYRFNILCQFLGAKTPMRGTRDTDNIPPPHKSLEDMCIAILNSGNIMAFIKFCENAAIALHVRKIPPITRKEINNLHEQELKWKIERAIERASRPIGWKRSDSEIYERDTEPEEDVS